MGVTRVPWWKSTYSGDSGCVEIAFADDRVAIRDSKDEDSPILTFTPAEWAAFIKGVRNGEFEWPDPISEEPINTSIAGT